MGWQMDQARASQAATLAKARGTYGRRSSLPAPEAASAPAETPTRTFGGAAVPATGGVYTPEMATAPPAAQPPATGEVIPADAQNPDGGVVGGNIEAGKAAEAAPEAPAAPATPAPGIIRSSLGGSMVRFQNPNGVEEIRGTGRPSWQLYQGTGQLDAYPAAVQNWHSGLVKASNEAEKNKLDAETRLEIARTPAREAPGQAEERRIKSYLFDEGKKKAEAENLLNKQNLDVKEYKNQLVTTPYATFKEGVGHVWEPKTEDLSLDAKAGENIARDQGWKAGLDHLHERQIVRKYLGATASYQPGINMNAVIDDLTSNPQEWKKLVGVARQAGTTSAPVKPPGMMNTIFPTRPAAWGPVRNNGVAPGSDVLGQ